MLGECDADHGFRTLDYWAREKVKRPNSLHYAVLVAENLQGRFKTLTEMLPQFLPFIAIEIRTIELTTADNQTIATIYSEIIAQPDDAAEAIDLGTTDGDHTSSPRDEDWWRSKQGDGFVDFIQELASLCQSTIGTSRIDYTASSYISLKKGRRAWLPMWPRTEGCYVYVPDDGSGKVDEPSDRFRQIQERLQTIGLDASWTFNYNAGANPIAFAIPKEKYNNPLIISILDESYQLA